MKPLRSVEGLAWKLNVKPEELESLASNAVRSYRPFHQRGGKRRLIANPVGRLKGIQDKIHRNILQEVPLPGFLHGGVSGKSPLSNAKRHAGAQCVIRIDIRDFFPSVTSRQVYDLWVTQLGFSLPVARLLTPLTTYRGCLPLGAPTSTFIANLILADADAEIIAAATEESIKYTRFVDDLVFSGRNARNLIAPACRILKSCGFQVSYKKLNIMGPAEAKLVTGLSVNRKLEPSVLRSTRDKVRAAIFEVTSSLGQEPVRRTSFGQLKVVFATSAPQIQVLSGTWLDISKRGSRRPD